MQGWNKIFFCGNFNVEFCLKFSHDQFLIQICSKLFVAEEIKNILFANPELKNIFFEISLPCKSEFSDRTPKNAHYGLLSLCPDRYVKFSVNWKFLLLISIKRQGH